MKTPEKVKLARLVRERLRFAQNGKPRKEAEICSKIGRLHIRNGSYQEAIKAFKEEMELWIRQNDAMGQAMTHRSLGECYAEVGYFPTALGHHNQYMAWAESNKNYAELQRSLATLGRTYICKAASADDKGSSESRESITKSEEAFLRSMSVCDNHLTGLVSDNELQQMKARLYLNLGLVYMHQENYTKSVVSIEKGIKISQEHNKMEDLYRGHLSLGDVYLRMNNTSQSLQALDIAFSISKKLKDKEKESDVLIQRAHVHFILGEYAAAEGVLRRVCAIGAIKVTEKQSIIDQIKTAKKCCKLQAELKTAMEEVDLKRVMVIHEQLGDCCCKVNIYREALLHYNKQLECALTLQLPDEQLSPIYVSLAATYADSQQYGMAVTMYGKELQLREGNSKEECKTWLNVADAQEKAGHSYEALQESYVKAAKFADKAGKPKLKLRVLKSLAIVQERFGRASDLEATRESLSKLKEEHQLVSDNDSFSEEEQQPLAESSDDSDEDIEALVNGPQLKKGKDTAPPPKLHLQDVNSDILNKWLDTNEDDIPQEPNQLIIKMEGQQTSDPCGDAFTPSVSQDNVIVKAEPPEEAMTSDPQPATDDAKDTWNIKCRKGKTLISRNTPTKAKKRTLSDSDINGRKERKSPHHHTVKQKIKHKDAVKKSHHSKGKLIEKYYTGDRNVPRKYFTSEADGAGTSDDKSKTAEGVGRYPVSSSDNNEAAQFDPCWNHPASEDAGVSPDSSLPHPPVEERMPSIAFVHPPQKKRMRVRVRFKRTVYLVNIPMCAVPPVTFRWLADEASLRYQESHGLKPKVSLTTTDHALISPKDVVSETLTDNEEVIANIESLVSKSSPEKRPQVVKSLSEGNQSFSQGSIAPVEQTSPLMAKPVSLLIQEQCQLSLQILSLSRSQICDEGISQLANMLQSLSHITRIDLSHNGITYKGLQNFCQVLFPESVEQSTCQYYLENLKEFDISDNPLTDNSAIYIANLISHCRHLEELSLASSLLTTQFVMDHHAVVLQTAFESAPCLQTLDISQNVLGSTGIEMLLKFLNPEVIKSLNMSSVVASNDTISLCKQVASYFNQTQCALHTLHLEGCFLSLKDMQTLSVCVPFTKVWQLVNLSSNSGIANQGILTLLRGWNHAGCCLGSLDVSLCGLISPLGNELITLLANFMTRTDRSQVAMTTLKLSNNKLSDCDLELLKSIWVLGHGSASHLLVEQMQAVFTAEEEN